MDKSQNPTIALKNIYAFIDPTAKGKDRGVFHLFVAGKNNFGMFMHNGKKFFVEDLKNNPQKIVFYAPRIETNLFGQQYETDSYYCHASNNIAEILTPEHYSINGIEKSAIEAIRPITKEQTITLKTCRLYENLFVCVQNREKKFQNQSTLMDFCKE